MEGLLKYLQGEGRIVLQAPLSFAIVGAILVGITIMIANWYYAGQIASKNSLIDLQKGRLDDYKEKLNGASPDEAKTRMKALQAEVDALKPRQLSRSSGRFCAPS